MRIVIVGGGKVGVTLTEQLSKEGHDLIVVDNDPQVIENVTNHFDVIGIVGNGASYDVLTTVDVARADLLIAATPSDEINILSCMTAKKIGVSNTIARVRNPDYSKQLQIMREDMGLSMAVNPELETAQLISRILRSPAAISIEDFSKGRVEIIELKINANNPLRGKSLSMIYHAYQTKILICAVQRGENVFIPNGNFILQEDDRIHVSAAAGDMDAFIRVIGFENDRVKSVIIVGGGKISYFLAKELENTGIHVKIIEQDEKRCEQLCDNLANAHIVRGDGSDHVLLLEEGIEQANALVALTDMDEENILISMYASSFRLTKIVTKVNRNNLLAMLDSMGFDSIVSPKRITANRIVRYVRAMENASGSDSVQTLYKLVNDRVEALEFFVAENTVYTGKPLKELSLRNDVLIAGIIRRDKLIVPHGNDTIEAGDNVIVVTNGKFLKELKGILQ